MLYPNPHRATAQNQKCATDLRKAAAFIMANAARLPEMVPSYDGIVGYLFESDAPNCDMLTFVASHVSVLFYGSENFNDVSYIMHRNGGMAYVRRHFGRYNVKLAITWKDQFITPTAVMTPSETVEAAMLKGWRDWQEHCRNASSIPSAEVQRRIENFTPKSK